MANAIERRVSVVEALWNGVVEPEEAGGGGFLVRWLGPLSDLELVGAFVRLQEGPAGQSPDLFLRFETPFEGRFGYADALVAAFAEQFEASLEDLRELGLATSWRPALPDPGRGDAERLLETCRSFIATYGERFRNLVLVLVPKSIERPDRFRAWLLDIAGRRPPEALRLMVLDRQDAPILDAIDEARAAGAPAARTIPLQLEMDQAVEELLLSGSPEGPGKVFLVNFMAIGSAAKKGNVKAARRAAREARIVARREGWLEQEIVVHLALAAGYLSAGRPDEAARTYDAAMPLARQAEAAEHPAGLRLLVTTTILRGSALLAGKRLAEAAAAYKEALAAAERLGDPMMQLEAARMAAYCHELSGERQEAWHGCRRALRAGSELPPDQREVSTLPYVGEAMLRLLDGHERRAHHAAQVEAEVSAVLGAAWHGPEAARP